MKILSFNWINSKVEVECSCGELHTFKFGSSALDDRWKICPNCGNELELIELEDGHITIKEEVYDNGIS